MVKFLTRPGCHLCEQARPLVVAAGRRWGLSVEEVDIESDSALLRDYGLRIPVVLGPEGAVIAEGEITDGRALARRMREAR